MKWAGKDLYLTVVVDNSKGKRDVQRVRVTVHVKGPRPKLRLNTLGGVKAGAKLWKTLIFKDVPKGKANVEFKYDVNYVP